MDAALLEAVQRANKVFCVCICFSRAKRRAAASSVVPVPKISFGSEHHYAAARERRGKVGEKKTMGKLKGNE